MNLFRIQLQRSKRIRHIFINNFFISLFLIGISVLDESKVEDFVFIIYLYFALSFSFLNYGLLIFSWDYNYLRKILLLTKKKNYIQIKHTILMIIGLINTSYMVLVSLLFFKKFTILILSLGIFNLGFLSPLVLLIALSNFKRIEINKHRSWNFEGMSFSYYAFYLLSIVFVALTLILVEIYYDSRVVSCSIFTALGIIGFLLKGRVNNWLSLNIQKIVWKVQ